MENRFNGVFFVEDCATCNKELKNICLRNNINIEYELDFDKLLSRAIVHHPELLILNLKDYKNNNKYLQIFKIGSPFYIPIVLVIGTIQPDFALFMPSNYFYLNVNNFEDYVKHFEEKLAEVQKRDKVEVRTNYKEQIYQALIDLGLNASTSGTNFIKECINEIMINKCRPSTFSKTLYQQVAFNYKTTPASVARCMKVAIDTAWKRKDKNRPRPDSQISFDEFIRCPTAKEFIYFVANKLYNYNQEEHFKKLAKENIQ